MQNISICVFVQDIMEIFEGFIIFFLKMRQSEAAFCVIFMSPY